MTATARSRPAFTMVELLVVISVIAVLVGLLLPALAGAQRRGKKAEEMNRIRQVGVAWNLYSNANQDSVLPGFLEDGNGNVNENVQGPLGWNVRYKLPATLDSAANPGIVAADDAEEWPWRLLPYLDYDQSTVIGNLGLEAQSSLTKAEMSDYDLLDPGFLYGTHGGGPVGRAGISRPSHIAREPTFGYNAYYVGGWWHMDSAGGQPIARHQFWNAVTAPQDPSGGGHRINVVVRSPAMIRNVSKLILFCSSAGRVPGEEYRETRDDWPGMHYVVPPILGDVDVWGRSQISPSDEVVAIEDISLGNVPDIVPVPAGRYTGQASVLHADMHTEPHAPGALDDQRYWINAADSKNFRHQ